MQGTDTYVAIKRMPLALQQSRPFDGVSALTPTRLFVFHCIDSMVCLYVLVFPWVLTEKGQKGGGRYYSISSKGQRGIKEFICCGGGT